jgi:ubiquitin carboxyl-terminal hydrolase 25/28
VKSHNLMHHTLMSVVVQALQTLFKGLITSSAQSVKPTVDLAELTLVSSETDANFRRASISSPQRNFSVLADRPVFGPELPPPPPPPSCPPPPIPTRPSLPLPNESDIEMIDRPQKEPLPLDDDSDTTLIDIEPKQEQDQPNGSGQDETLANVSMSSGTITPGTETNDQQDIVMTNGAPLTPPPETNLKIPERKPPVPPRNKPSPIKIKAESNDATRTRTQRLEFGAQQDVTEVIGNVMFRLQCAIKATSIDPRFGEQIDKIRETFFGANAVYLKKGQSYDIKVEDWANLIIFPAADGPRDIYEALDVVFDEQVVEIDKTTTTQFASIKKLPPIVQIQIQRTAFDAVKMQASKNPNRILFDETIYLDRYMDSDKILQRRKDSWKWKQRIRALEARQKALLETPVKAPVTEVLEATKNFINLLEEEEIDGIDVDPKLSEVLEERKEEIAQELELIHHQIATLRTKLQDQFTDMRQQRYRLQAVFIHRGSSNYGHYWIYIYDFARDIWREYNDERVSVVDDRNKIFDPSGSNGATPYYLVYVRDEDKDELVDAVCREIAEDNTEEDITEVWESGVDDAAEIRNGSSQHVEDYSAFQPVQNAQEVSDLRGIGAWETVVKPEANPQDRNFQWQV